MAETALHLQTESTPLQEVLDSADSYMSVDHVPELAYVRRRARFDSYQIAERHRQLIIDGKFDEAPIPVDALGTARKTREAKEQHGANSKEFCLTRRGLVQDCVRLYAEAYRKLTYEYFGPTWHEFDWQKQEHTSNGQSILSLTDNGLSPLNESEEFTYRVNDRVEEVTYNAIRAKFLGRIGLHQTVRVMKVAECPDWAIAAYKRKSPGGWGGYVPQIEKLMVSDAVFDPRTGDRYDEQVALPGKGHIKHEVVLEALRRRGVSGLVSKIDVHGAQLFHDDDVFDFVALLDTVASEFSDKNIFMGEEVAADHPKDYSRIRAEATARQSKLTDDAEALAEYVLELEAAQTDRWVALNMVEDYVKKRLLEAAVLDNAQAAVIFDEQTAKDLREVEYLQATGRYDEALYRLEQIEAQAPPPGYCGAGSCGLEAVDVHSDAGKELKKLLKAEDGDTIVRDKERECKCGKKSIVYAYNKNKVNKYCESCGAFESKRSKAA